MPYDYTANPRNFLFAPGDPNYSANAWVRSNDPTYPFTRWFYHPTLAWKRGFRWVFVGGTVNAWKPAFSDIPDAGPNALVAGGHCNAGSADTNPPTYTVSSTFTFSGDGATLQLQVQWYLDGAAFAPVQTIATGIGYKSATATGTASTPTTSRTGVDDEGGHTWTMQWRQQDVYGTWGAWTAATTSASVTWQACGRSA